jgi:hypothetical protein
MIWNTIATDIYYRKEANIWQNQKDCVQFDPVLLYKPSSGCSFNNIEFSTMLTFSSEGRASNTEKSPVSGHVLLLVGDSLTMGWGVNDDETFAHLIASNATAAVFNLGVASYGTARELYSARLHPRFADANCIIIQYSENDLSENYTFVRDGTLPEPTRARFQELLNHKPGNATFLDIVVKTYEYMLRCRSAFFSSMLGLQSCPSSLTLLDDAGEKIRASRTGEPASQHGGVPQTPTSPPEARGSNIDHANMFINTLNAFPELNTLTIFVIGPDDFIDELALQKTRENLFPIRTETVLSDAYTIDGHLNKNGHKKIATKIVETLRQSEKGRECLYGR